MDLSAQDAYFQVLADELDQPIGAKFANDALNLMYFWPMIHQFEDIEQFDLLDMMNSEYFQTEMLKAFDALEIDEEIKNIEDRQTEKFMIDYHHKANVLTLM